MECDQSISYEKHSQMRSWNMLAIIQSSITFHKIPTHHSMSRVALNT